MLANAAVALVDDAYRDGYRFAHRQTDLFERPEALARREKLNRVLDQVNNTFGRESLRVASSGRTRTWAMKREHLSPRYTTRWPDIVIAHAR